MNSFKHSIVMLLLAVAESTSADQPTPVRGQVLNIYGSSNNLSETLRKMKSGSKQPVGARDWKFFSGRALDKAELAKFCPNCTEIDPLPEPIQVNPCKKDTTFTKSPAYSYRLKGTPSALAGLVAAAGHDKDIQIQNKYVLQMVGTNTPAAETFLKALCKDCIEVDPLPSPIPVGGGPCN